jgi:hypothetical protein
MVKLYISPNLAVFVTMSALNVKGPRLENVLGSHAIIPTKLSPTKREMEKEFLVLIGNASTLNAVFTTKQISTIQL